MTGAALAHRRTELDLARRDVQQRDELLRGVVLGDGRPAEVRLRIPLYGDEHQPRATTSCARDGWAAIRTVEARSTGCAARIPPAR